jgi:2,4-dienoyl-CoA reductase-like NADH-dependent reductase (Old Yellow Enzyme family)
MPFDADWTRGYPHGSEESRVVTVQAESLRVFSPAAIGGLRLRNRFIRSAAFEGMCPDGEPSAALVDYHRALAAGGVAMTTVAYAAVSRSGRSYLHQLCPWKTGTMPRLRQLTDAVHSEGAAASIQLAHGGYAASPAAAGGKTIGPSAVLNRYNLSFPRAMTEGDIETVTEEFGLAARSVVESGFDAVEIHAAHGYLLSQFLSPHTNRRSDRWGGSLENRLRFPIAVIRRIRRAVGPEFPILVKVNLRDGFGAGLDLDEAVDIAKRYEAEGVDALVLSGGFMTRTPIYVMRGDVPRKELRRDLPGPGRKLAALLFGRLLVRKFPFTEAYFLEDALHVREVTRLPLVLVGGLRRLEQMEQIVGRGFEFVAMARPFILEPDLVKKFETGSSAEARCVPCNKCLASVAGGTVQCVLSVSADAASVGP